MPLLRSLLNLLMDVFYRYDAPTELKVLPEQPFAHDIAHLLCLLRLSLTPMGLGGIFLMGKLFNHES